MSSGALTVPAQLDSLVLISEFVNSATHHAKLSEREAWHMQLAVDEAATNIIQHAYADRTDGVIELSWRINDGELIFTLIDRGRPFDPTRVPTPDIHSPFEDRQAGGLGIYLMNKLMDAVHFSFDARGNTLEMRKRFAQPNIADVQSFVLAGRLDARNATNALAPVTAAVAAGARVVVIDLSSVSFMSSSGLRALLLVRRELNEHHGLLALCGLQAAVEEVFVMTGFAQVFEIYRTVSEATIALRARVDA